MNIIVEVYASQQQNTDYLKQHFELNYNAPNITNDFTNYSQLINELKSQLQPVHYASRQCTAMVLQFV